MRETEQKIVLTKKMIIDEFGIKENIYWIMGQ